MAGFSDDVAGSTREQPACSAPRSCAQRSRKALTSDAARRALRAARRCHHFGSRSTTDFTVATSAASACRARAAALLEAAASSANALKPAVREMP